MIRLEPKNLSKLSQRVKGPAYDRALTKQGIVHIGIGGFHRSHQAYIIQQLLQHGIDLDWAICGLGLRKEDFDLYKKLNEQKGLYSLITRHPNGKIDTEIIGAITAYIWAYETPERALEKLANSETKIVSLTITEGGYNFSRNNREFDFTHPDVLHDLKEGNTPKTVFGYLTEAARRRMTNGIPSFTLMSCDNIEHNGDIAKKMFLAFAERKNKEVHQWMLKNMHFPNSMVDRITPTTTQEDINYINDHHHFTDLGPVTCEPFIQWIIEDKFSYGRPSFDKVGVQIVSDVTPYEKMKLRLLNAGHSVLGIPGALHGYTTIHECMLDPVFKTFMRLFMDIEATPTLDPVPGIELDNYKQTLEERFGNINIKDSVERICSESSAKLPTFLFDTISENLDAGRSISLGAFIISCWFYYHQRGMNEEGKPLRIIDQMANKLKTNSKSPIDFISNLSLFGKLSTNEIFINAYLGWTKKLDKDSKVRHLMIEIIQDCSV